MQNTSVLENHHWKSAVGLLRETGLFSHLPAEDRSVWHGTDAECTKKTVKHHIRKLLLKDNICFKKHICSVLQRKWRRIPQLVLNSLIILSFWPFSLNMERELGSLILATDISRQNDYLSKFRLHLDQENLCLSNASHRHFLLQVSVLLGHPTQLLHLRKNCELLFCFFSAHHVQMALKCADICNPCRPWELSKQWSEKVTKEFFQQGFLFVLLPVVILSLLTVNSLVLLCFCSLLSISSIILEHIMPYNSLHMNNSLLCSSRRHWEEAQAWSQPTLWQSGEHSRQHSNGQVSVLFVCCIQI